MDIRKVLRCHWQKCDKANKSNCCCFLYMWFKCKNGIVAAVYQQLVFFYWGCHSCHRYVTHYRLFHKTKVKIWDRVVVQELKIVDVAHWEWEEWRGGYWGLSSSILPWASEQVYPPMKTQFITQIGAKVHYGTSSWIAEVDLKYIYSKMNVAKIKHVLYMCPDADNEVRSVWRLQQRRRWIKHESLTRLSLHDQTPCSLLLNIHL